MNPWLIVGLCFTPSALIGAVATGAWLYDRRRDRGACQRIVVLIQREAKQDEFERFAELCAWFAPQAAAIKALPEADVVTLARRFL